MGSPAFGDAAAAFRANNVVGNAEGYMMAIDLENVFGLPFGLRLRAGTRDKIVFRVRDNLSSGIDEFNIVGYGTKIKGNGV